ncbi:MAG TPA: hypothetical protein VMU05_25740 [Dongiaceae bacterium]|nr:hypothetical protein [Dongiaceae bacterium]
MSQIISGGRTLDPAPTDAPIHTPKRTSRTLTRNILYYGSEESLPEQIPLRAGPLSLVLVSGQLRHICLGEHEVLRRIYVAVRDRNWRTVPSRILKLSKSIMLDSFEIAIEIENRQGAIDFCWHASITGSPEGTIRFAFDGLAKSSFFSNRIGLCVLHPIRECAGRACEIETTDGQKSEGVFPKIISPHQVFKKMRSISHQVAPGVLADICFEGDTFEMEDQRNWSDASYKTYCPPLEVPYPMQIEAGRRVSQSVALKLRGTPRYKPRDRKPVEIVVQPATRTRSLPRLGLAVSSTAVSLSKAAMERLKVLNLSHLRVDLKPSSTGCETLLRNAAEEAAILGCRLETAVFLSDDAERECDWLRSMVERIRPPVCHWLIFHQSEKVTGSKWLALARAKLTSYQPTAKFGGGTNAYFAELGRSQTLDAKFDLIAASLNPQVHQFDNQTLAENLEAQSYMVQSARQFWPGLPLAITPITLRPRFNAEAKSPCAIQSSSELPTEVDVRQMSLFGAAWTAGSLKQLCESGVYSATYYETVGWRGVMENRLGSPLPAEFPSIADAVFPLYHVFADVGEFASGSVVPSRSSSPDRVSSLVLENEGGRRILLSNLGSESQNARIPAGTRYQRYRLKFLDESSAEWAMSSPESFRATPGRLVHVREQFLEVEIPPFATARVDCA